MVEKVVYTGGTFDLFHRGHVNFLRQCKKIGKVVVSLNTDDFVAQYKGKPPVMTFDERRDVLLTCKYVDDVVANIGGKDSKPAILSVKPDFIAIADDWAKKDYYAQMSFTQEWLDQNNITLLYIPYTRGVSTTEIKERMREYLKK